jgi:hypothetical protein
MQFPKWDNCSPPVADRRDHAAGKSRHPSLLLWQMPQRVQHDGNAGENDNGSDGARQSRHACGVRAKSEKSGVACRTDREYELS